MTAGHCAYDTQPFTATIEKPGFLFMNFTTINVRIGIDSSVATEHKPTKVYIHPTYNPGMCDSDRVDIAIYEIDPPFIFNENVKPVRLPPATEDHQTVGLAGTFVSGFGLTEAKTCDLADVSCSPCGPPVPCGGTQASPTKLLSTELVINEPANCINAKESTFCALGGPKGICTGDSGSGFVVKKDNEWTLIGNVRDLMTVGRRYHCGGCCGKAGSMSEFTSYKFIRSFVTDALAGKIKDGMPALTDGKICVDPQENTVLEPGLIAFIVILIVIIIIVVVVGCFYCQKEKNVHKLDENNEKKSTDIEVTVPVSAEEDATKKKASA